MIPIFVPNLIPTSTVLHILMLIVLHPKEPYRSTPIIPSPASPIRSRNMKFSDLRTSSSLSVREVGCDTTSNFPIAQRSLSYQTTRTD